jgi:hypothetical protein
MSRNASLVRRIREIREDLYGEFGIEAIARALNLPEQTWRNFERGVTMPAEIMLKLLDLTDTDPHWALTGEGERCSPRSFLTTTSSWWLARASGCRPE